MSGKASLFALKLTTDALDQGATASIEASCHMFFCHGVRRRAAGTRMT